MNVSLADYELIPCIAISVNDEEHLGRIKVAIVGEQTASNCQIDALPWVYPFTMSSYHQAFNKLIDNAKVWVFRNKNNPMEMWYIPMFELNPNTQSIVDGYDNTEVLVSRDLGEQSVYIYYNDSSGIVLSVGNTQINIGSDGTVNIGDADGGKLTLKGGTVFLNTDNQNKAVKGNELHKALDQICKCLETLQTVCMSKWTTTHIQPQIEQSVSTLRKTIDGQNYLSENTFIE